MNESLGVIMLLNCLSLLVNLKKPSTSHTVDKTKYDMRWLVRKAYQCSAVNQNDESIPNTYWRD